MGVIASFPPVRECKRACRNAGHTLHSPSSLTGHTLHSPSSQFLTAPRSCANPRIAIANYISDGIPIPVSMVATTNDVCSRPRRGGGMLKLAGKEKKFRVATKEVSPLDAHHPQSAMASRTSPNSSHTSPLSPPGPPRPFR